MIFVWFLVFAWAAIYYFSIGNGITGGFFILLLMGLTLAAKEETGK